VDEAEGTGGAAAASAGKGGGATAEPPAGWAEAASAGTALVDALGGEEGVAALLGQRETAGSTFRVPPSALELMDAARAPHGAKEGHVPLTVAARAAAKHAHRGSDGWFGDAATGTAESRNARAAVIVARILAGATWWNAHDGVFAKGAEGGEEQRRTVLELRVASGYGARWMLPGGAAGPVFRGFLEPHSEEGHAKGWRH